MGGTHVPHCGHCRRGWDIDACQPARACLPCAVLFCGVPQVDLHPKPVGQEEQKGGAEGEGKGGGEVEGEWKGGEGTLQQWLEAQEEDRRVETLRSNLHVLQVSACYPLGIPLVFYLVVFSLLYSLCVPVMLGSHDQVKVIKPVYPHSCSN